MFKREKLVGSIWKNKLILSSLDTSTGTFRNKCIESRLISVSIIYTPLWKIKVYFIFGNLQQRFSCILHIKISGECRCPMKNSLPLPSTDNISYSWSVRHPTDSNDKYMFTCTSYVIQLTLFNTFDTCNYKYYWYLKLKPNSSSISGTNGFSSCVQGWQLWLLSGSH